MKDSPNPELLESHLQQVVINLRQGYATDAMKLNWLLPAVYARFSAMRTCLRQLEECNFDEAGCASLAVASARIRKYAEKVLS